jgi:hypothetical protein
MEQLEVIEETETADDNDTAAAEPPKLYLELLRVNERTGDLIARQDPAHPQRPVKVGQRVHIDGEPCRVRRITGELVILTPLQEAQVVRGKAVPEAKESDASRGLRKARLAAQDRALKRKRHAEKMEAQKAAQQGNGGGLVMDPLAAMKATAARLARKAAGGAS